MYQGFGCAETQCTSLIVLLKLQSQIMWMFWDAA